MTNSTKLQLTPADNNRLANLCGQCNENITLLEKSLNIELHTRGHTFYIKGAGEDVDKATSIISTLYAAAEEPLSREKLQSVLSHSSEVSSEKKSHPFLINTPHKKIKPHGENQQCYVKAIKSNTINFGIGPAGTGKTYLAVACAVEALLQKHVQRLILVRPAVEAGESLGFLPGDFAQKVDPYLRPIYDALYEMLGVERVMRLIERNVIEVAPLAYMRGRSLNDAFIILDEAQNTTPAQMKMFLTRLGFGSTMIVTGDITQTDLPRSSEPGLAQALAYLKGSDGISFTFFEAKDVTRHPLVKTIIQAYESRQR